MIYNVSVWNSGYYTKETNELRQQNFMQKVKNIKGLVVKENHIDYAKVIVDDDSKIKEIIKDDFEDNGYSTPTDK